MKRREFITLLGGAAAWPFAARAQQPTVPVIGWLSVRSAQADAVIVPVFRQELNAHGFIEGRNVAVEYRYAEGQPERLPTLAAELLRSATNLLVTIGTGSIGIRAVRQIHPTIPIVFLTGTDPIDTGIVTSLSRPSGNIAGFFINNLVAKRIEILHQLLSQAKTIAVLVNPTGPGSVQEGMVAQHAARLLGLQSVIVNASSDREIYLAFELMAATRPDALLITINPFFSSRATELVAATARIALPAIFYRREYAAAGGLVSYGDNPEEGYRVIGEYVGRILKGEKVGDLPVQRSTKFELVINLKTAKALGLTVPPTLLAIAGEVIE